MKVALIGSGGREHAIAKYIIKNKKVEKLYILPGNGGTASLGENVEIGPMEFDKILDFVLKNNIEFVVVAPDDPLAGGLVDRLNEVGVKCFGPTASGARLEGSKVFAKEFMARHNIPTASFQVFDDYDKALAFLKDTNYPTVIKADGLALGKGVVIPKDFEEAKEALRMMMKEHAFGKSGDRVLIEQCLTGPEVSVLCFADGKKLVSMVSSMDHKRIFDGDNGLNTGGMGVVAPNPYYTKEIQEITEKKIITATMEALKSEGIVFKGCLYFGLMLTDKGPMVIEYNARFGDPETQCVLPLLQSDLFDILLSCENGTLQEEDVRFKDAFSAGVVLASGGYPGGYEKGKEIDLGDFAESEDVVLFCAGTKKEGNKLYTNGGRVLLVNSVAPTLEEAISKAYKNIQKIKFENSYMRTDIGKKALEKLKQDEER